MSGHVFHDECIESSGSAYAEQCPYCRQTGKRCRVTPVSLLGNHSETTQEQMLFTSEYHQREKSRRRQEERTSRMHEELEDYDMFISWRTRFRPDRVWKREDVSRATQARVSGTHAV